MEILRTTFGPASWRRVGYAAVSAPVGVAAPALTLVGRPERAGRPQHRVARALLGGPVAARPHLTGTVACALLSIPLGVVGLWLVRGLTGLQRQLADGLLGGGRVGLPVGAASALVLVGGAAFLTAWVHQI